MTDKTHTLDADGTLYTRYDNGTQSDPITGRTWAAGTQWSIPPSQIEKSLPQFQGEMRAGDLSAARDAAAAFKKELAKRQS